MHGACATASAVAADPSTSVSARSSGEEAAGARRCSVLMICTARVSGEEGAAERFRRSWTVILHTAGGWNAHAGDIDDAGRSGESVGRRLR